MHLAPGPLLNCRPGHSGAPQVCCYKYIRETKSTQKKYTNIQLNKCLHYDNNTPCSSQTAPVLTTEQNLVTPFSCTCCSLSTYFLVPSPSQVCQHNCWQAHADQQVKRLIKQIFMSDQSTDFCSCSEEVKISDSHCHRDLKWSNKKLERPSKILQFNQVQV